MSAAAHGGAMGYYRPRAARPRFRALVAVIAALVALAALLLGR